MAATKMQEQGHSDKDVAAAARMKSQWRGYGNKDVVASELTL